ncbi:SMI1/KNR4 family protein SUKH-1 [Aneurinibacillus soli]|uniref:Uncharacterized protein n=1 Tax=Aneurinibacillus soli TaxID=1500254 RepID=A0A0U5B1E2_9BACL|nr:SMI1/KNR4 family protein [Aneurinibacillus soli]PYE60658.1 SMI1/KNR4 family protein SUKH-1 [Aneurinibacillus soli]BAU29818.1 hypothetical protein CB4_04072 [Aneurinibacillus soli]
MQKGHLVKLALDALKKRLADNDNVIEIYSGEGYVSPAVFTFNLPISPQELNEFIDTFGIELPIDYKNFLLMHNGAELFKHPEYGGEFHLYDLAAIEDCFVDEDWPKHWLPVAYHYGEEIIIDLTRVAHGMDNYLIWRGCCAPLEESVDMGMSFEQRLDRSLICQGVNFWQWSI